MPSAMRSWGSLNVGTRTTLFANGLDYVCQQRQVCGPELNQRLLAELIKDRPIVGIHAVDLVWGLGTLHCLTQQEPALES